MRQHGQVTTPSRPTTERWMFAFCGLLTGAVGLAVSTAAAWMLRTRTTPLVAVAEGVRDLTPGPLATWLVHLVGSLDKPLLFAGTATGALATCLVAGALARRHPLWSDLLLLALTVIGAVAAIRSGGIVAGLCVLLGFMAMLVAMRLLVAPLRGEEGEAGAEERRTFLRRSGLIVAGGAAFLAVGRFAGRGRRAVEQSRRLIRVPGTRGVVPRGAALPVDEITPWRTSARDFYLIDTALAKPSIRPSEWSLRVHGLVDREITLTYEELLQMPPTEGWVTLACVSNEVGGDLIGNAWWTGVPIRDVLARAGVGADCDAVLQTSEDGWTCLTPIEALTDDRNALLAYAMNGETLEVEHGFPVRSVVPGLYGYVSATKWVVDFELTRFDRTEGYWTPRGWSAHGPVKTQSRIDVPRSGASVPAGLLKVGGVAWAQHTGIERVEYSLDDGPWQTAGIGRVPNNDTWVQWSGQVDVEAGSHELRVRATDRSGETQTSTVQGVLPDGATGWHTVDFDAE